MTRITGIRPSAIVLGSMFLIVLLGILLVRGVEGPARQGAVLAAERRPSHLESHGEQVPDFAARPTLQSVRSGAWSDVATWDTGRVPGDGDVVQISAGTEVRYDVRSDARLGAIGVAGELTFRTDASSRLRVTHLLVYEAGTLRIGDRDDAIRASAQAEVVFNDQPLLTGTVDALGTDPFQYGNGLLVWGRLSIHGAEVDPTFLRLAAEPRRGDVELALSAAPRGWRAGDRVLLPDSRLVVDDDIHQVDLSPYNLVGSRGVVQDPHWETAEVARVEGTRLVLTRPLVHDHPAGRNPDRTLGLAPDGVPLLPHVANVSRNVILRSENPQGVRGHTIYFRGASVTIVNASFQGLGRTTAAPLDSTRSDADGRVSHIGANQLARYAVHVHHLVDPRAVGADGGAQFEIAGSVVENALRWGISIHGSHFGLIRDNVVFDVDGSGIVTEDGSETGNRFDHNFVAAVRGTGQTVDARRSHEGMAHEGAGFWLGSDNNIVVNNVVAGVRDGGFTLFRTPEALAIPAFPGRGGGATAGSPPRVFEFSGNEVYGAAETGIELWDSKECDLCKATEVVLRETTVWHSRTGVRYDYHADHYRLEDLLVHGDPGRMAGTHGVLANYSRRAAIARATLRYVDVGIDGGGSRNREMEFDQILVRARIGVRIRRGSSWDTSQSARFRNLDVTPFPVEGAKLVELYPGTYGPGQAKVALRRPIYFFSFQNQPGLDFSLFYDDQAPDYQMPYSADPVLGCPEAGLSNAECRQAHGIAMGGELATCDRRIPGLDGFACPVAPESFTRR